jgi:uncharacterized repeat protein (TIGR03803 family)
MGNLYGTTASGGAYGAGTVFQLTPSGGAWTEKVIYSFSGSDGGQPNSLVSDHDSILYGATSAGGGGGGVIYQLAPGDGGWVKTNISTFDGCTYSGYGGACNPVLAQEQSGNLYGFYEYTTQICRYQFCFFYTLGRSFQLWQAAPGGWRGAIIGDTYNEYCYGAWCYQPGIAVFEDVAVSPAGTAYASSLTSEGCWGTYGYLFDLSNGEALSSFAPPNMQVGPSGDLYGTYPPSDGYPGVVWELTPP